MKKISMILIAALLVLGCAGEAKADAYVKPSLSNIVKTLVRFGALDIRKDNIIDAYGRVTECRIFMDHYHDDFKWQKVRGALRQSIKQNIATFPVGFKYDAPLQLDRYDFKRGQYRFTKKTAQASANVFTIYAKAEDFCTDTGGTLLPYGYQFVLDQPVKMEGLPLSAEEGNLLLQRMVESGNKDRKVYARFNIRVVYVAPLVLKNEDNGRGSAKVRNMGPMITQNIQGESLKLDSRLDSIEYFEDQDRTKLIYRYVP